MTEATLTRNGRHPRQCDLHGGRECRGGSASVRPEQARSSAQYGNSVTDGQLTAAFLLAHAFSLSLAAEVGRDVSLYLVAERLHAPKIKNIIPERSAVTPAPRTVRSWRPPHKWDPARTERPPNPLTRLSPATKITNKFSLTHPFCPVTSNSSSPYHYLQAR